LLLVPAKERLLRADLAGRQALAAALGGEVPESWPPEHHGRPVLEEALDRLGDQAEHGWSIWYLVQREGSRRLLGFGSFAGRPDEGGIVEISYSVLPDSQGRGLATEAVQRLAAWAFSHPQVQTVFAETLPHLRSSIRVLQKNGFRYRGRGSEYGLVRYELTRARLAR
jgi:RimJ/RimL family protein N-acetyltransferase